MKKIVLISIAILILLLTTVQAAEIDQEKPSTLYDVPPRWLVDVPTAGTLPRAFYQIGFRVYPGGGAIGFTDIGLSNRLTLGISYGADNIISNEHPDWNPDIEFSIKFRIIDEIERFPGFAVGFCSQGYGAWNEEYDRFTFKSRGFYGVFSQSFYFYQWTAGWHGGVNYSQENDGDEDDSVNLFAGFDATFKYNLALLLEFDGALNDDRTHEFTGSGRGYLNISIKWLFDDNLELEALLKDLLSNRRGTESFTRELRLTYIDCF